MPDPEPRIGRTASVPSLLDAGIQRVEEFNPMLELFSTGEGPRGVDSRSEVTDLEALQFSRGRFLAAYFRIPELDQWIDSILRLKISRHRKSRVEAVDAVRAMHGISPENRVMGLLERLKR